MLSKALPTPTLSTCRQVAGVRSFLKSDARGVLLRNGCASLVRNGGNYWGPSPAPLLPNYGLAVLWAGRAPPPFAPRSPQFHPRLSVRQEVAGSCIAAVGSTTPSAPQRVAEDPRQAHGRARCGIKRVGLHHRWREARRAGACNSGHGLRHSNAGATSEGEPLPRAPLRGCWRRQPARGARRLRELFNRGLWGLAPGPGRGRRHLGTFLDTCNAKGAAPAHTHTVQGRILRDFTTATPSGPPPPPLFRGLRRSQPRRGRPNAMPWHARARPRETHVLRARRQRRHQAAVTQTRAAWGRPGQRPGPRRSAPYRATMEIVVAAV